MALSRFSSLFHVRKIDDFRYKNVGNIHLLSWKTTSGVTLLPDNEIATDQTDCFAESNTLYQKTTNMDRDNYPVVYRVISFAPRSTITFKTIFTFGSKMYQKSYKSRNIIKLRAVNQSKANLKTNAAILGADKTAREGGTRSTDGSRTFYRISRYFHCQR